MAAGAAVVAELRQRVRQQLGFSCSAGGWVGPGAGGRGPGAGEGCVAQPAGKACAGHVAVRLLRLPGCPAAWRRLHHPGWGLSCPVCWAVLPGRGAGLKARRCSTRQPTTTTRNKSKSSSPLLTLL
jgi:hypothetical protein